MVAESGIRNAEENREIPNFNGFYRGYDPSAWAQMTLTSINAPIRIGRATVLPGDLVLAKTDGVIFIPAILAEQAIISAEFTNLEDAFNFELNRLGKNGAEFEGGWTPAKYDALARWIDQHPEKLKMSRAQFNSILEKKKTTKTSNTLTTPIGLHHCAAKGRPLTTFHHRRQYMETVGVILGVGTKGLQI
jgi:hypothetical protein